MDRIDKKLVTLLQDNARLPLKNLAEKVFLSSPAVSARIERLEEEGIILKYEAKVDYKKLGYNITAFINVEVAPVRKQDFYEFINKCPSVIECNCVTGVYSMLLKVVGKDKNVKIVTSGSGAAGIAIVKLLLSAGFKNIVMTDRSGAIVKGRENLNSIKEKMAEITNPDNESGSLSDVIKGADVFIGISAPGLLNADMVKTMNEDAIIFACANPVPEILPDEAKAGGAKVIATGRSDFPNQINNVLAFPGIFRGTFDVRASEINEEMKMAAAHAIAELVSDEELNADYIIPKAFDPRVGKAVAKAVAEAARKTNVARI